MILFNGAPDTWILLPGSRLFFTEIGLAADVQSVRTLARVKKSEAAAMSATITRKFRDFTRPLPFEYNGKKFVLIRGMTSIFDLWKAHNEKQYGAHISVFPEHTKELKYVAGAMSTVHVIRPTGIEIVFHVFQSLTNGAHDADLYRTSRGEDLVHRGTDSFDGFDTLVADTTAVMFCIVKDGKSKISIVNDDGDILRTINFDMRRTGVYSTCYAHDGSSVVRACRHDINFDKIVLVTRNISIWFRHDKRLVTLRKVQTDNGVRFALIPIAGCDHKFIFYLLQARACMPRACTGFETRI